MKFLAALIAVAGLASCNTMIGLGRDTKAGFIWSKNKIQEKTQGGGGGGGYQSNDAYGAPVY